MTRPLSTGPSATSSDPCPSTALNAPYLITTGSFSDDAQRMIESGTMKDRLFLIDGMTFNQWRTQSGLAPVHYLSLAG